MQKYPYHVLRDYTWTQINISFVSLLPGTTSKSILPDEFSSFCAFSDSTEPTDEPDKAPPNRSQELLTN